MLRTVPIIEEVGQNLSETPFQVNALELFSQQIASFRGQKHASLVALCSSGAGLYQARVLPRVHAPPYHPHDILIPNMLGGRITPGRAAAWTAGACAVLLLGVFVWRIAHYTTLIRSGELDPEQLAYLSSYTPSAIAAAIPLTGTSGTIATTDDPTLGSKTPKISIVEFADFGCPYSRESSFVLRSLAAKYGDIIQYQYRDFPIIEPHPEAERAAEAANCAAEQGKFWEYHDKLYVNQTNLAEDRLVAFAKELNLNERAFTSCLSSGRYTKEIAEDFADGVKAGVRGTPTFFINGTMIPGSIPEDVLEALVKRAQN
jgi:protein-disulfide isomerase